jgi:hypothetical protein
MNLIILAAEDESILYGHRYGYQLAGLILQAGEEPKAQVVRGIELGNFCAYLEANYLHLPEVRALVESFETYMLRAPHDKGPVETCLEAVSSKVQLDLNDVGNLYASQEWMRRQGFSSES